MSDSTAISIFRKVFVALAKNSNYATTLAAREIYKEIKDFDFSPYEMNCYNELKSLGLVKEINHPVYGQIAQFGFEDNITLINL